MLHLPSCSCFRLLLRGLPWHEKGQAEGQTASFPGVLLESFPIFPIFDLSHFAQQWRQNIPGWILEEENNTKKQNTVEERINLFLDCRPITDPEEDGKSLRNATMRSRQRRASRTDSTSVVGLRCTEKTVTGLICHISPSALQAV